MSKRLFQYQNQSFAVTLTPSDNQTVSCTVNDDQLSAEIEKISDHELSIKQGDAVLTAHYAWDGDTLYVSINGESYQLELLDASGSGYRPGMDEAGSGTHEIGAPMPGRILKIFVEDGQEIQQNQTLFIVEAMKMENEVKSSRAGVVKKVLRAENELVSVGDTIVELEP